MPTYTAGEEGDHKNNRRRMARPNFGLGRLAVPFTEIFRTETSRKSTKFVATVNPYCMPIAKTLRQMRLAILNSCKDR